jgi:hypothetical protein
VQEQRAGRVSARMMEEFPSAPMRGYLDTPEERMLVSPVTDMPDSPYRKVGGSTYGMGAGAGMSASPPMREFFDTLDGRTQTLLESARKQAKRKVQTFVQSAFGNRGDGAGAGTPDRKRSGSKRAAPPALSPQAVEPPRESTRPTGDHVKQMNFKRDEASTFSAWKVSPEGRMAAPRGTDAKKVWMELPREDRMRMISLHKQKLNFDGSPIRTRSMSRGKS